MFSPTPRVPECPSGQPAAQPCADEAMVSSQDKKGTWWEALRTQGKTHETKSGCVYEWSGVSEARQQRALDCVNNGAVVQWQQQQQHCD
jgi:hypothetical protein